LAKTCLLITERLEPTADLLLAELRRRDIPCVRWNLDQFPGNAQLTYRASNDHFGGELAIDERKLDLALVGSIWCRGFRPSGFPEDLSTDDRKFVENESQRALDALLTIMGIRWINHPQCHARANAKAAQLYMARQLGLDIPPTVITNDAAEVRRFARESDNQIVYKAHSQSFNLEPGKVLYTGIVSDSEIKELNLIEISPGIFQKYVSKAYEVRATVVGSQIFTGKINSQASAETAIDWRRRPYDIEETPIRLPADVEDKMLAFMRAFGLYFGAFDFIVTPDGRHVFLEINPAGQYLWVEAVTKLPITAALADELSEPCRA
jgi:glutathione synthase/RimK-type ligase-like ATP-grasp enzyme